MHTAPLRFSQRAALGVADANLKRAMASAEQGLFAHADKAMEHPDYQSWREQGAQIKDYVLANLASLLEEFEQQAIAAGAQVHWAKDAAQARHIVAEIAQQHNVAKVIKSKSMLSEEIHLNDGLEEAGIGVLETDLGEYVVQLGKTRPSHIIAPIIHMTADQVSEIFANNHGEFDRSTKEKIVHEARLQLRPQMINAELGITGANFLVANSGSVVIVTNEGNGRYCTTAPKVRVTIAGIEKVLPSFTELATMLRLLPRAATGQTSSSYVSISTGANKQHKPHQHHIVLIDNGRSKMLGNKYRKMLRCIRCGSCMNHCPVYKIAGGLSYNSVYSGPMGAVLSPNLFGPGHEELPHAATMCAACSFACPVKIPLPDLMRNLREDQVAAGEQAGLEKLLFAVWIFLTRHPRLYHFATRTLSALLRLVSNADGVVSKLPFAGGWFATRKLVAPTQPPFRTTYKQRLSR